MDTLGSAAPKGAPKKNEEGCSYLLFGCIIHETKEKCATHRVLGVDMATFKDKVGIFSHMVLCLGSWCHMTPRRIGMRQKTTQLVSRKHTVQRHTHLLALGWRS